MRHQSERISVEDPEEVQQQQEQLRELPTQPFCTENGMPDTELQTLRSNGAFECTYYDSSNAYSSSSSSVDDDTSTTKDGITPSLTNATKLFALCAALNSCNLGYDIGVSTNAGPQIQAAFALSDVQLEWFLGSLNFWSIFGCALISPVLTDRYGRRCTFLIAAMGFVLGICGMSLSTTFLQLMTARMIVGLAVGCGEAIDPMYISEIAPASHRGELVSWAEAGVALGVVLGFASSLLFYPLIEHDSNTTNDPYVWRYMVGLGAVLPMVMIGLVCGNVMPESPRWLLSQAQRLKFQQKKQQEHKEEDGCLTFGPLNACDGKDQTNQVELTSCSATADILISQARDILRQTHPPGYDVDRVVQEICDSLEVEHAAHQALSWTSILLTPTPSVRRMLLVGVGIAIIQQAVGIDSIMFYMAFVIQRSGVTSELGQILSLILLGTVKLVFVFVGAKLFDHLGRRPLVFTSLIGTSGLKRKQKAIDGCILLFGDDVCGYLEE